MRGMWTKCVSIILRSKLSSNFSWNWLFIEYDEDDLYNRDEPSIVRARVGTGAAT